jgi:histidinol-phosphate aminotransferase
MEARVARITEERGRVAAALRDLPVDSWPSDANFILFRPRERDADAVWRSLLDHSVLIRNCASWDGLKGCLRVTIGTAEENERFLHALKESL